MKFSTGLIIGSAIGVAAYLANQRTGYLKSQKVKSQYKANILKKNILETKNDIEIISDSIKNVVPGVVSDLSTSVNDYTEDIKPNITVIQSKLSEINDTVSNLNTQN